MNTQEKRDRFTGILAGWDDLISEHYKLRHAVTTITAARKAYEAEPDLPALFRALFERMEENFKSAPKPSVGVSNWKLRQAEDCSEKNCSLEKLLEKQVATLAKAAQGDSPLSRLYNQIPAASGYASPTSNRKNSIDLVYEIACGKEYAFIELKVSNKSGTPFYAAYENLSYGFLYLLTRTDTRLLEIFAEAPAKPILNAEKVHLIILAPNSYYAENRKFATGLKRFEEFFNTELRKFAKAKVTGLEMGFEFRQFSNPVSSREDIDVFTGFEPAPYGERLQFEA